MKPALMVINSVRLICRHCGYECCDKYHAKIFTLAHDLPATVECQACHEVYGIPSEAIEALAAFKAWRRS